MRKLVEAFLYDPGYVLSIAGIIVCTSSLIAIGVILVLRLL